MANLCPECREERETICRLSADVALTVVDYVTRLMLLAVSHPGKSFAALWRGYLAQSIRRMNCDIAYRPIMRRMIHPTEEIIELIEIHYEEQQRALARESLARESAMESKRTRGPPGLLLQTEQRSRHES